MEIAIKKKIEEFKRIYDDGISLPLNGSLFSGGAGVFIFRLYLQRYLNTTNSKLEEELIAYLEAIIESNETITSFGNGTAGFAWFLVHLHQNEFIELDEALFESYDTFVYDSARLDFEKQNHDFMHGGLGKLVYLTERVKYSDLAKNYVLELLEMLVDNGDMQEDGLCWKEHENYLAMDQKGCEIVNFHMSHGQIGKVVVLSNILSTGILEAKVPLINAIQFMFNHLDLDSKLFPYQLKDGVREMKTHSGWCRSNIAMGLGLLRASEVLGDDTLKERGEQIGLLTLHVERLEKGAFSDISLCHGTAGISHMYNRYYLYSGNSLFKDAAERWMQSTLDAATFIDGAAGYKSWSGMQQKWNKDYGFLTGTAGVGLAMLAFLSPKEMNWDGIMLLN